MEERDRIDIIATLHDRFNKPADEIIRKMERLESQADDTGESVDNLESSLDQESRTTRGNSKAIEENTKSRRRHGDAVEDADQAVTRATRNMALNTESVRQSLSPTRKATEAQKGAAKAAEALTDATVAHSKAQADDNVESREARRVVNAQTRAVGQARDAMGRFIKTAKDGTETLRDSTRTTQENTESTQENTKTREKDHKGWAKWDARVRKITSSIGGRFRPIGAFFQNYFKILGAFRAILFSDIGALIPQLVTGIVAIGAAAVATLGPLGRMAGNIGQLAPLIAAFVQTQTVVKWAISGVSDALKVLNDEKATLEELNAAMAEAGPNTWAMAKAVKALGEDFKPLKRAVRETFLEGMAPAVTSLAQTYLPILRTELTKTADIMNGRLLEGMKGLQTDEKQKTIADVMERSSVASGLFVDIAFSLLDVFVELADAAGPAFLETLEAVDGVLGRFADWIRENKDGLTDFFNRSQDTAGNFLKGIGFIMLGLSGMAAAAKPLEDFLYGGLLDRLESWSEAMNSTEGQAEMTKNYEAMIPNLEAIGNLIGAVIDGAKEIATSEYFAPLVNDLADNGIPLLVEYLKKLDETVGPQLLRISDALDDMDPAVLTSILAPLGDMLGLLASALETVVPLFNAMPEPMQKMVMYGLGLTSMGLPGFFMLLLSPLKILSKIWGAINWGLGKFAALLVDIAESPFGKKIGLMVDKIKLFFKPISDFIGKQLAKIGGGGLIAKIFGKVAGKGVLAALGPIGAVIGVLWILWDVIKYLWDNVKPFRDFMTGLWDWIVQAWSVSIDWIVNTAIPWVVGAFQAVWDGIKSVGTAISDFWTAYIWPVIDGFITFGKIVWVTITTMIILPWVLLWNLLKPLFVWVIDQLQVAIPVALGWLSQKWSQATAVMGAVWGVLKNVFMVIVGAIIAGALWLWNSIKNVLTWIGNFWATAWNTMRDLVTNVWNWIKNYVIAPVVAWLVNYVWPVIQSVINFLVSGFTWLRDRLSAVWSWIKNNVIAPVVNWFLNWVWPVFRNVLNWLGDKFSWLKDRVVSIWDTIKSNIRDVYNDSISPIFDKFESALDSLKSAFNLAKDSISKAWGDIKEAAKVPIAFVIDNVYNKGIMPVWNKLADAVNLDKTKRLTEVKWAKDGYDRGGYTGPGSKHQPAGVVHADEFVIKKESQRSLRRAAPGLLDDLNNHGARALGYAKGGHVTEPQGYAGGGKVKLSGWRQIAGIPHAGMAVTSTFRGGARTAGTGSVSKHATGNAVDFAGAASAMKSFFNYVRDNYSVSELIHTPMGGRQLSRGGIPRANFPAATARSHSNHVHVGGWGPGEKAGFAGLAGLFGRVGSADSADSGGGWLNPFEGMLSGFLNKLPGEGGFKDIAVNATTTMVNKAKDFAWDFLNPMDNIAEAYDNVKQGVKGAVSAIGTSRWTNVAANALKHTGDYSTANLQALMRRMNQESSGNQYAINKTDSNARKGTPSKGLMQVIDPTFRANRDPSLSTDIYDPMANIVASIRYAKGRYGNLQSAYNRPGGYAKGGLVIDDMKFMGGSVMTGGANTLVGELGPELFLPSSGGTASILGLNGPEIMSFDREGDVLPHHAVAALSTINSESAPVQHTQGDTYNFDITANGSATAQDVKQAVRQAMAEVERNRKERR